MLGFYIVKILSIFFVSLLYFIFGTGLSVFLEKIISKEDPKKKSFFMLVLEIGCIFGIIAVLFYFMRIGVKHVPFFLDGMYGFKYSILKEVSGGIIITYILFTTQTQLKQMVTELHMRINSYI
jgi:uncharacterized membrane protein YeiB